MTAVTTQIRILGVTADITYRLDKQEHARRQTEGMPRITDMGLLDKLMNYPYNLPVPFAEARFDRRLFTRRLLERDGTDVIRRIRPPLVVDLALVPAKGWKSGLNHASRFAPFSTRAMVLAKMPKDPGTLIEIGYWGVGLYTANPDGQLVEQVKPQPWVKQRHTPAGWMFLEEVYQQVTAQPALTGGTK
jgi:hypothetical protein